MFASLRTDWERILAVLFLVMSDLVGVCDVTSILFGLALNV